MYINEQKIEDELSSLRAERTRLQGLIESLDARESGLVEFLARARNYEDKVIISAFSAGPAVTKPGTLRLVAKNSIGGKARARRVALGMSQQRVANLVGCSNETVSSVELNRSGVSNEMRTRVLKAIGLSRTGRVLGSHPVQAIATPSAAPSLRQQTIVAQAVAASFEAGTIINGRDVFTTAGEKLVEKLKMPETTDRNRRFTPTHLIANLLMLEARDGGILERISTGHYRVRENANDIIANRLGSQE